MGLARLLCKNGPQQSAPGPRVYGVDISSYPVAYTRLNAARLNMTGAVEVRQGSWGDPLAEFPGRLGGLVSNPPYIPAAQMAALQAEVGRCVVQAVSKLLQQGTEGARCLNITRYSCERPIASARQTVQLLSAVEADLSRERAPQASVLA